MVVQIWLYRCLRNAGNVCLGYVCIYVSLSLCVCIICSQFSLTLIGLTLLKLFCGSEEWEQTGAPNDYMEIHTYIPIHTWIRESRNACVGIRAIVMGKTL